MKRFVEGLDRPQGTLFPERLEDWIRDDNPVRVIDVFVDELDLGITPPLTFRGYGFLVRHSRQRSEFARRQRVIAGR